VTRKHTRKTRDEVIQTHAQNPMSVAWTAAVAAMFAIACLFLWIRSRTRRGVVGFLHHASGGGGGGERVLWVAIQHLLRSGTSVVLLTSRFAPPAPSPQDDASATSHLIDRLLPAQFGITLTREERARLTVCYIRLQWLQEPALYPVARLVLQSAVGGFALALGTLVALAAEYPGAVVPELLIDTVGVPFSYLWLRLAFSASRVGCYVHYPLISSDMLDSVASGRAMPNNPVPPAAGWRRSLKLAYYRAMIAAYRWAGGSLVNGPVACNSTWTRDHIVRLWGDGVPSAARRVHLLFPPVNVERFRTFELARPSGPAEPLLLISVGQFRPEKDHALQLRAFARALALLAPAATTTAATTTPAAPAAKLLVIGGARNAEDRARVTELRALAASLGLRDGVDVEFHVDAPFADLEAAMRRAVVGLHTMRDEHFGIVVVEYMASGCVPIAHRSAGPAEIVREGATGFLCCSEDEYAAAITRVVTALRRDHTALDDMRRAARDDAARFGDAGFSTAFGRLFAA
jgi:alpha-1,2-mannosyltransferase